MGKCINCHENDVELAPSPKDYVDGKHLTLFGWTLILYRESVETIDDLCNECLIDRSNANEQDRMEPALDDAYNKGYDAGLRDS